MAHILSLIYW